RSGRRSVAIGGSPPWSARTTRRTSHPGPPRGAGGSAAGRSSPPPSDPAQPPAGRRSLPGACLAHEQFTGPDVLGGGTSYFEPTTTAMLAPRRTPLATGISGRFDRYPCTTSAMAFPSAALATYRMAEPFTDDGPSAAMS